MQAVEKIDWGKLAKGAGDFLKKVGKAGVDYCKQNPEACAKITEEAISEGKAPQKGVSPSKPSTQPKDYKKEADELAKVWQDLKTNPTLLSLFIELVLNTPSDAIREFGRRLSGTPDEKAFEILTRYIGISPFHKSDQPARVYQWKDEFAKYRDDGLKFLVFTRALAQGKIDDAKRAFYEMSQKAQDEIKKYLFPVIGFSLEDEEKPVDIQPVKPKIQFNYTRLAIVGAAVLVVLVAAFILLRRR